MNLPLNTDLTGKVAVITGAGGVLCAMFSKALAQAGARVAVLDLNEEAAQKVADEITAAGGIAKAYKCNVLDKESMEACHQAVLADLGPCDILLNGAGGNNPRATTDKFRRKFSKTRCFLPGGAEPRPYQGLGKIALLCRF